MSAIKRTGPPVAIAVTGDIFQFEAPLSEKPSLIWWQAFRNPGEWTTTCHPQAVSRVGERLIFDSREEDVPTWITSIDRWSDGANGELSVDWKRERISDSLHRDGAARCREVTVLFSHL